MTTRLPLRNIFKHAMEATAVVLSLVAVSIWANIIYNGLLNDSPDITNRTLSGYETEYLRMHNPFIQGFVEAQELRSRGLRDKGEICNRCYRLDMG